MVSEGVPIGDKGDIGPTKAMPGQDASSEDNADGFKNLVNQGSTSKASKPTPMDAASGNQSSMQVSKATPENLVATMANVLGQMKSLGDALNTPNLKLNARTRRLLDAKLKRSKDHIQYVSAKVNVGDEGTDKEKQSSKKIPQVDNASGEKGQDENASAIRKFLGYITDGQAQLESAMHNVSNFKADKNNPGMMLEHIFGMQVKMYRAQVEIEFSSAVLQKAIDDLKTIMSVQL